MNATEIINTIMKGSTKASISQKQFDWLLNVARKEGRLFNTGFCHSIYFEDKFCQIRNCKRLASGGSYVGTAIIQGRYNVERLYHIKFKAPPCLVQVARDYDLAFFTKEGHEFEIITPTRTGIKVK